MYIPSFNSLDRLKDGRRDDGDSNSNNNNNVFLDDDSIILSYVYVISNATTTKYDRYKIIKRELYQEVTT